MRSEGAGISREESVFRLGKGCASFSNFQSKHESVGIQLASNI